MPTHGKRNASRGMLHGKLWSLKESIQGRTWRFWKGIASPDASWQSRKILPYLPAATGNHDDGNDNSALPLNAWIMNSTPQQLVYFGSMQFVMCSIEFLFHPFVLMGLASGAWLELLTQIIIVALWHSHIMNQTLMSYKWLAMGALICASPLRPKPWRRKVQCMPLFTLFHHYGVLFNSSMVVN